jgi:hypothetical protein
MFIILKHKFHALDVLLRKPQQHGSGLLVFQQPQDLRMFLEKFFDVFRDSHVIHGRMVSPVKITIYYIIKTGTKINREKKAPNPRGSGACKI